MATTTNYGWTTPDDTALVKDGAAAIRSLGSSIDSTLKTQIDAQIPDSIIDAKGDLIAGTADNTPAKLSYSGSNGDVLQVDTSTATGLKWAPVVAGYSTFQSFTSTTTWTVPAGITKCAVYAVGAGGGGGSGRIDVSSGLAPQGSGGTGGNIGFQDYYKVTPGDVITVTIGAGGTGGTAVSSVSTLTVGNPGGAGNDTVFGNITVKGAPAQSAADSSPSPNTTLATATGTRSGGQGGSPTATFSTVSSLLNTAGSLGANGSAATAGTTLGTTTAATVLGFAGGGGGGGRVTSSSSVNAAAAGVAGGGSGGAGAASNSNITTTAGAGGNGAANTGGGGGGGGAAEKVGTTTTFVTSGAGGNGGSGFVIIYY